jgi:hypothetical protein
MVEPVKPPSPFVFPPLPAPELLPPVTLDVLPNLVRSTAGSVSFGSPAPLPSSSVGVGARLTQPIFPPPPLFGAAELGEKIRSSLPML